MIDPQSFLKIFIKKKITLYCGVPDSVLKNFIYRLEKINSHYICANEGSAVAMAIGHHLSTKELALVYMQNSGLSNAINPLISIAGKNIYSIPMVILIGWRGAPKTKDEPQHLATGKITLNILKNLKIKYLILKNKDYKKSVPKLINYSKKNNEPVAILCKNSVFQTIKKIKIKNKHSILREYFIYKLLENLSSNDKIISTTGFASRELHQIREMNQLKKGKDFYMVGGMGHASMVALGVSLRNKFKTICLDGDGSFLMHMGNIATMAAYGKNNLKYILLNNVSHESVGGQKTILDNINVENFSKSLGFDNFFCIKNNEELKSKLNKFLYSKGPSFLEVKIKIKSMKNLKRPTNFLLIKKKFMN
jgi:phosphonopyruvate decarboxylase